jgi:hypothetical protein
MSLRDFLRKLCPRAAKPQPLLSYELECRVMDARGKSSLVHVRVVGTEGLCLLAAPLQGTSAMQLVQLGQATDPKHWKRLWSHFNGGAANWTWDDGTPFNP